MQIERILVVDDELLMREFLGEYLKRAGYEVELAESGDIAIGKLESGKGFDLVLTDINMDGANGLQVLKRAKEISPSTLVVLMTANATLDTAIEAVKQGAFDYLTKPLSPNQLDLFLCKAGEYRQLVEENKYYRRSASRPDGRFEDLVGRSETMKEVFRLVDKVAASSATVLIAGESGTGKELIARAIHQRSDRADKPFIRVNCAALPESLLESELFGHERGAFTGAVDRRPGRFELAHTGTLLLDEISETTMTLQSKLLRILQEREFERVGGTKTLKVDVRVICTSNRDLRKLVKEGKFREDLFYRLNVVPISLPALRVRGNDILLIGEYFLRKFAERHNKPLPTLTPEARFALLDHNWPGNVRELENTIERAVLLTESQQLTPETLGLGTAPVLTAGIGSNLDAQAFTPAAAPSIRPQHEREALQEEVTSLAEMERKVILRTLKMTNSNRTKAARILGISVRTLYTKLREYESGEGVLEQETEVGVEE